MIILELPPSTNGIYGNRAHGRYLKSDARAWKWNAAWQIKSSDSFNLEGNYRIEVELHLVRDRDIDGSLKLLLDSMTGIVYNDDRQVTELEVKKHKSKDPHLKLSIILLS